MERQRISEFVRGRLADMEEEERDVEAHVYRDILRNLERGMDSEAFQEMLRYGYNSFRDVGLVRQESVCKDVLEEMKRMEE